MRYQQRNSEKIGRAFATLVRKKNSVCQSAMSAMMQEAVGYAMEIHENSQMIDYHGLVEHPYHSEIVEHDFGWSVSHDGVVLEMGVGYGTEVPGRYQELLEVLSSRQKGWAGIMCAIVEPLETPFGDIYIYSADFEEAVFDAAINLTKDNFLDVFEHYHIKTK